MADLATRISLVPGCMTKPALGRSGTQMKGAGRPKGFFSVTVHIGRRSCRVEPEWISSLLVLSVSLNGTT